MGLFDVVICKVCIMGMIVFAATNHSIAPNHRLFSTSTTGEGLKTEEYCPSSAYTPPAALDLPRRREPGGTR